MSTPSLRCPTCDSSKIVKNGKIHNGKQNHKCTDCGRQFVEDPQQKRIGADTKRLIDKRLREKIPLADIARSAEVSEVWLQRYVNAKYAQVERQVTVSAQKKGA
jgi:transposase-like protein